jgi:short-subunit dehydrogenase
MNHKKRILIIGATSAIAEQCARLCVQEGLVDIVLVGRSLEKTDAVAADLRVRSPGSTINTKTTNFLLTQDIKDLVDGVSQGGAIDIALIAHGSLPNQETCQNDLLLCEDALLVNGVSPVLFAESIIQSMVEVGAGTLGIIGSVAGDRGRKSNYVYGSAKGLVERYAQGLQHRLAFSGVSVVLIKPGPTDTPMTSHLKMSGQSMASVETVAQDIVKGINLKKPIVYTPSKWALIMLIIKHLPRFIFNKMDI